MGIHDNAEMESRKGDLIEAVSLEIIWRSPRPHSFWADLSREFQGRMTLCR